MVEKRYVYAVDKNGNVDYNFIYDNWTEKFISIKEIIEFMNKYYGVSK